MQLLEKEQIVQRLATDFKYPEQGAGMIAEKLLTLQSSLQAEFAQWWQSGIVPTIEIEGYTVAKLQSKHGMNPVAAILTLDWLLREPEKAKNSLRRGHDRVEGS